MTARPSRRAARGRVRRPTEEIATPRIFSSAMTPGMKFDSSMMYYDLRNKFKAARETQAQNQAIKQDLEQQLRDMTTDLHGAITRLQAENDAIEDENDRLCQLLESLPADSDLEAQLNQMKAWDLSMGPDSISFVDPDFLDTAPFIQMGILKDGESLISLPARIAPLVERVERMRNHPQDEAESARLRRQLELRRVSHTAATERAQEELRRLEDDLRWRRRVVARLEGDE
jgi:hypothetical protein